MAWIDLNASDPPAPIGAQNVHFRQAGGHTGTESDPVPTSAYLGNQGDVRWSVDSGIAGTDVGNIQAALRDFSISTCVLIVTASDPAVDLNFDILLKGVSIFSAAPSVPAGSARAAVFTFDLSAATLSVAFKDDFSLSITSGSAAWKFAVYVV